MDPMPEILSPIVACFCLSQKKLVVSAAIDAQVLFGLAFKICASPRALGLGAAPTLLALRDQDALKDILNLPASLSALSLITVGDP
jgi:hypothetical protein|tara:strand:+ start:920 stop:1177 length:258 start_codon:yes stop_codon:yes gene_type:complete